MVVFNSLPPLHQVGTQELTLTHRGTRYITSHIQHMLTRAFGLRSGFRRLSLYHTRDPVLFERIPKLSDRSQSGSLCRGSVSVNRRLHDCRMQKMNTEEIILFPDISTSELKWFFHVFGEGIVYETVCGRWTLKPDWISGQGGVKGGDPTLHTPGQRFAYTWAKDGGTHNSITACVSFPATFPLLAHFG